MNKTSKKIIYYKTANIQVPIIGYQIKLMDFELSRIEDSSILPEKVFLDIMNLMQKMNQLSFNFFNS